MSSPGPGSGLAMPALAALTLGFAGRAGIEQLVERAATATGPT